MAEYGSRRMRRLAVGGLVAFSLACSLASCRRAGEEKPVVPPDQLANAIEDVRQLKEEPPPPPKRLGFLTPADLGRITNGTACTLRQGDRVLLVAGALRALARVD